jgi:hypothetical protein
VLTATSQGPCPPCLLHLISTVITLTMLLLLLSPPLPDLPPKLAAFECADCNLTGSLPPLPPALRRLDLSDNNLVGDIQTLDISHLQVGALVTLFVPTCLVPRHGHIQSGGRSGRYCEPCMIS